MSTRITVGLAFCAALLSGCASTMEPKLSLEPIAGFDLVDTKKVDAEKYRVDHTECANIANQDALELNKEAARLANTLADKATAGLLGMKMSKHADRQTVLKRCLSGRGYQVLR